MKRLWKLVGTICFWLSWPALFIYLRIGKRTRVIVYSGEYILVTKAWLGVNKWLLPGGGLHYGESPVTGALRELQEETSLSVSADKLEFLSEGRQQSNGLSFRYTSYILELPTRATLTARGLEILEVQWIVWHELTPGNTTQDAYDLVIAWSKSRGLLK